MVASDLCMKDFSWKIHGDIFWTVRELTCWQSKPPVTVNYSTYCIQLSETAGFPFHWRLLNLHLHLHWTIYIFLTSGHSDAQPWASECPDVKNYKWRLNPVWHRMLYSCTHMATVGFKGLTALYGRPPERLYPARSVSVCWYIAELTMGHVLWPVTHVTHLHFLLTHLTHDPWPTDPLFALMYRRVTGLVRWRRHLVGAREFWKPFWTRRRLLMSSWCLYECTLCMKLQRMVTLKSSRFALILFLPSRIHVKIVNKRPRNLLNETNCLY